MPPNLLSPLGSFTSIAGTAAAAASHAVTTLAAVNTNEEHVDQPASMLSWLTYQEQDHQESTHNR